MPTKTPATPLAKAPRNPKAVAKAAPKVTTSAPRAMKAPARSRKRAPAPTPTPIQAGELENVGDARPIWEVIAEIGRQVPKEEWATLPKDFARNIDHYLYGCPRVEDDND